jgi:hypothetical protein
MEDRHRSREKGFDHHLVKPVDPVALQELIARSLFSAPAPPAPFPAGKGVEEIKSEAIHI